MYGLTAFNLHKKYLKFIKIMWYITSVITTCFTNKTLTIFYFIKFSMNPHIIALSLHPNSGKLKNIRKCIYGTTTMQNFNWKQAYIAAMCPNAQTFVCQILLVWYFCMCICRSEWNNKSIRLCIFPTFFYICIMPHCMNALMRHLIVFSLSVFCHKLVKTAHIF